jgi:hypothetical protein
VNAFASLVIILTIVHLHKLILISSLQIIVCSKPLEDRADKHLLILVSLTLKVGHGQIVVY